MQARSLLVPGGALFLSMPNRDCLVWRLMDRSGTNPYWGELEHYHNFDRAGLTALLQQFGFTTVYYGVSERYRAAMEIVAIKAVAAGEAAAAAAAASPLPDPPPSPKEDGATA
jgi:protein O-GlcNAc transferase